METAAYVQAVAAIGTFLAACVAVWAAFRAPQLAAEFAEKLRTQSERNDEKRKLKLLVLLTLMQYRRQIAHPQAVIALNSIDVVFDDSREIRESWRHFYSAVEEKPHSNDKIMERYLSIIEKISKHLGISENINISDIQMAYYPTALGQVDEAAFLETLDKIQRFRTSGGAAA